MESLGTQFLKSIPTAVTTIILGLFLYLVIPWLRIKLGRTEKKESELQQKKRVVLQNMLDLHAERVADKFYESDWRERFNDMRKNIVIWAPDKVLQEYALFHEKQYPESIKN